jgi:hypothetical protein
MNEARFVPPGGRGELLCMVAELDGQSAWVARRNEMAGRIDQARYNSRAWSSKRNFGEANGKARMIPGFIVNTQTGKSHRAGKEDRSRLAVVDLLPLSMDCRRQNFLLDAYTAQRVWKSRSLSA